CREVEEIRLFKRAHCRCVDLDAVTSTEARNRHFEVKQVPGARSLEFPPIGETNRLDRSHTGLNPGLGELECFLPRAKGFLCGDKALSGNPGCYVRHDALFSDR